MWRWLQSWLGGIRILSAKDNNMKVNLLQITVFLLPPALGSILSPRDDLGLTMKSFIFAFAIMGFVFILQSIVFIVRRNTENISECNADIDEIEANFDRINLFSTVVMDFVFTPKSIFEESMNLLGAFVLSYCTMNCLSVNSMVGYCRWKGCEVIENVLGWGVYAVTQYSLSARPPTEVNSWYIGNVSIVNMPQRPFYVILWSIIDITLRVCVTIEQSTFPVLECRLAVRVMLFATPALINFGILPPISAFIENIIEQCIVICFGYIPKEDAIHLAVYSAAYIFASTVVLLAWLYINQVAGIAFACIGR